ncbi:MAG: cell division protein SepF [Paenibacillaceae bacterium]|jgi:cell division inhibitor SepF|nr:cell division protein SepF [Paenibacillaceae bacterium]
MMQRLMGFFGIHDEEREEYVPMRQDEDEVEPRKHRANVVALHAHKSSKLVLCEPRAYEECQQMAEYLRSRRVIVVNLHRVRPEHALRIVDFLSGTVYALNGGISKVGADIFVCTPESIEIQGAISELLASEA